MNSGCRRCAGLCQLYKIDRPADLRRAIGVAHDNIEDGTLMEVPMGKPFSSIARNGPWDDVLTFGFRCTSCGQLFRLSAETYHGSGGEWRPVSILG